MDATIHNAVAVVIGRVSQLKRYDCYTREVVITTSRGERLVITLFGDCEDEIKVIELDEAYPSHSLRAA